MFIPIDRLKTILADLKEGRRPETPKPWLGMRTYEAQGRLVVADVTKGGPAEQAGVRRGDVVRGVGESRPETLLDFYRKLWATGPSGTTVTLGIERNGERRDIAIPSGDRYKYLRLDTSL